MSPVFLNSGIVDAAAKDETLVTVNFDCDNCIDAVSCLLTLKHLMHGVHIDQKLPRIPLMWQELQVRVGQLAFEDGMFL
jgi:hypothetical protein